MTFKAKSVKSTVTPLLTLGGQYVKSVDQYKYLGIVLDTELSHDKDIQRQLRYQYCAANNLRSSFSRCSNAVKNVLFRSFCTPMYASQLWCNFRKSCMQRLRVGIGVRGGESGGGCRPPGLNNFMSNSVFRAIASCSKVLNDKKYFNTVKNSRATLFFRASASCTKILNDKKYILSTVNSANPLFFRASAKLLKILNVKTIFSTVKNSRAALLFSASASCSKILNDKRYIFNTVKTSRVNSVFQGKRKLLKNS